MKLADYVVDYLVSLGAKHVFLVTGGAVAHVVDAAGRRKRERGDFDYVCVQHEQAGAMAAETYSRLGPGMGVVLVTSGPGATNLITGMCGCWFDSIPALFISGQVASAESVDAIAAKPRQVGFQETDIVRIVAPITKFAEKIADPARIRYCLERAVYLARAGRPGPALIDIPVDLQVAGINPDKLAGFDPVEEGLTPETDSDETVTQKISDIIALINQAERPVLLLGGGIKIAKAEREAIDFAEALGFPIVVSWSGFDILPHDHPQYMGHLGVYGARGANFLVQNADLLISLGSRLDTRQTGGRVKTFARGAKKVMVDIDRNEIEKGRGLAIDVGVHADVRHFLELARPRLAEIVKRDRSAWISRARAWKERYGTPKNDPPANGISAYDFLKALSDALGENETIVVDEGGNLVWTMQSFAIKKGQRLISTFGNSPMGYALPAAIGASVALGNKPVICIDGDGGFQPNTQELQTVAYYKLPLKIFIMNNRGMAIIKQFQDAYFDSNYYASSPEHGFASPDFAAVARAYGIDAITLEKPEDISSGIQKVLSHEGPILCNVLVDTNQKLSPKLEFGRPLEDMSPYLPREEFMKNMIVEPLPESKEIPTSTGWQTLQ